MHHRDETEPAAASSSENPFAEASAPGAESRPSSLIASPFSVADQSGEAAGRSSRLPEKRKPVDSPFQIADAEASPGQGAGGFSPFSLASSPTSPFSAAPPSASAAYSPSLHQAGPSPFSLASPKSPAAVPAPLPEQEPQTASAPVAPPVTAFAPAVRAAVEPAAAVPAPSSNQLVLRAIFGVDHEMTGEEMIQRLRALPGIRRLERIDAKELAAVEQLQQRLGQQGFEGIQVSIQDAGGPLTFVREGEVALAVQTESGFAPGVWETLVIVARELGRWR